MEIEFEWDEAKSERNLRERGLAFSLVRDLFSGRTEQQVDLRRDYGEV